MIRVAGSVCSRTAHGVSNFNMPCTPGQASPLRDPGTHLLVHLRGAPHAFIVTGSCKDHCTSSASGPRNTRMKGKPVKTGSAFPRARAKLRNFRVPLHPVLRAVGPEDVGTTGLRARCVAHGCLRSSYMLAALQTYFQAWFTALQAWWTDGMV